MFNEVNGKLLFRSIRAINDVGVLSYLKWIQNTKLKNLNKFK